MLPTLTAQARPRREREPEPEPEPAEEVAAPAVPPLGGALFAGELPLDVGPLPTGLANLSAQGCNACHFEAHDGWATSAHAEGWSSPAFQAAVDQAGTPACQVCHLPLATQQDTLFSLRPDDVNRAVTGPNPSYDATLHTEGVTCAACHVRSGAIVSTTPVQGAPHPMVWTAALGTSEACAACHQLTWPGADQPFYDTYGEWQRSPHAAAGIQCQDCHMGPGAGTEQAGARHHFRSDKARAVSLMLEVARPTLTRGSPGFEATFRIQNTGAGHHFPTGSPFQGVRLQAVLVGPPDAKGKIPLEAPFDADLARRIQPDAPYGTLEDTRIAPGAERAFTGTFSLPRNASSGTWILRVSLFETVSGETVGDAFFVRALPIRVD